MPFLIKRLSEDGDCLNANDVTRIRFALRSGMLPERFCIVRYVFGDDLRDFVEVRHRGATYLCDVCTGTLYRHDGTCLSGTPRIVRFDVLPTPDQVATRQAARKSGAVAEVV